MGIKQELVEKRNELDAVNKKIAKINKESKDGEDYDFTKTNELQGDSKQRLAEYRKLLVKVNGDPDNEIKGLGQEVDELVAAVKGLDYNPEDPDLKGGVQHPAGPKQMKSPGDMFIEAGGHKGLNAPKEIDVDVKTLMQTSAGWEPESLRTQRLVDYATRPIQVIDAIPMGDTGFDTVKFMEETTFTNNAAERAEAGEAGEAALAYTERSAEVEDISVWLPVTDRQMEDEPRVRSLINNRLPFMLRQRLDSQVLNGDGSTPNLEGILNKSGIQTFARSGDNFDEIYKAARLVRVTGRATPNIMVIHPTDYEGIRTARTNDGLYILGNPDQPGPERIWGLRVIESDAMPQDSVLVGDFANYLELVWKRGLVLEYTNSHSDYFIKFKTAVRASIRVSNVIYRAAAFCVITSF